MEKTTKIPLFRRCVIQNFPFIEEDFDALTDYGLLCKVVEYLNKVIEQTNATSTQVEGLSVAFNTLKDYVDHYFDNLDVQEEINNKLDEMAESGELEEIIVSYLSGTMQVIFPEYGTEGTDTLGDCTILKNGDSSLMIDTFTNVNDCYLKIKEALYNAGITTLTYLVITHYHGDHIGNVLNLLNDGYLAGCTVYLPRVATSYPDFNGNDIKTALTNAGVTWIEINNQSFTVGDNLTVQMLNGSATDYAYYENLAQTDTTYNNPYNDRSIVCDVEFKNKHMLFTGDLEYRGCDYIASKLSSSNYDLLKDCHHGYIANAPDFCARVNADFVIIPASIGMVNKNYSSWLNNATYWVRKSKNVAIQGYQDTEIVLNIDVLGIHTDSTYFVNDLSCAGILDYYVDANSADSVRNGSIEHPFKTLNEAAIFCPKNLSEEVRIHVLSLPVSNIACNMYGFNKITVLFDDGVQLNSTISFTDCTDAKVSDLTQTSGKLYVTSSNIQITNYTNNVGANAIDLYKSKAIIDGTLTLTIDSADAISVRYNTELSVATDSNGITLTYAENTTKRLFSAYSSTIYFNSNAINSLKEIPFATKIMDAGLLREVKFSENVIKLLELFQNDSGATSGDLKEAITNYQTILIDYKDNDGYRKIERISRWSSATLMTCRGNDSETWIKSANFTQSGTTFTLTANRQTTVKTGGNANAITSGTYIKIVGIYGQPALY